MKVVERKISELINAEYNPRRLTAKQAKDLEASLSGFGIVEPIVINTHPDRPNIIIGGHQRVEIAKRLKYKTVPCVELCLDIEREKELNIRLNKNTGDFDFELLANQFEIGNLVEWGFEPGELGIDLTPPDILPATDEIKAEEKKQLECPSCGHIFEEK